MFLKSGITRTQCCLHAPQSRQTPGSVKRKPSIAVVGGGAAGLTAAYFAAVEGAEVTVLERTPEAGRKILISGGTRCNVLPGSISLQDDFFTESSTSALRAIFSSWSHEDCLEWLESPKYIGIQLAKEQNTNKYFPVSNSSQEVRDKLVAACTQNGVKFIRNASVEELTKAPGEGWHCVLRGQQTAHSATHVVLATGGMSFPRLGTDGTGHRILRRLGHLMHEPYPALTPLTGGHPADSQLAGVSLYGVGLQCQPAAGAAAGGPKRRPARRGIGTTPRSGMLFTHRGFSGPAVLDLSHHAIMAMERGQPLPSFRASWTGETAAVWEERLSAGGPRLVASHLRQHGLPQRLAEALCKQAGVLDRKLAELRKAERQLLVKLLTQYELQYTGHEGYGKAEVTGGGIPLSEVNCATMESSVCPGIFLCGELLDVHGRIGGFNFYWAWLSGRLAGLSAAASSTEA